MRVMIDSNILDRLDADPEVRDELSNRRDILMLVTPAQEREVAALSDPAKRERLLGIMTQLCHSLALPGRSSPTKDTAGDPLVDRLDTVDDTIVAASVAAGCDMLVSEDLEVLNKALGEGLRAVTWRLFLSRVVWAPRKKPGRY